MEAAEPYPQGGQGIQVGGGYFASISAEIGIAKIVGRKKQERP